MESLLIGFNAITNYFYPIYVLEPGWETGNMAQVARRLVGSLLAWGGLGAACLGLAVWRLRGSYIRQLENSGKKQGSVNGLVQRAPIGDEPIRWKEREVDGVAPLALLHRIPFALGLLLVFLLTVLSSLFLLWLSMANLPTGVEPATAFDMLRQA